MSKDLMQQGIAQLLSPEEKFEKEKNFGKKIYYTAWAIEILAALIGLLIAAIIAYQAYYDLPEIEKTLGAGINALIGALPFLVIAIIEPTKIPLAYGLYKVKLFGWKMLILVALLSLTFVTFETMFTGLERNLNNITNKVVRTQNQINTINGKVSETQRQISDIEAKTPESIRKKFKKSIDDLMNKESGQIGNLNSDFEKQSKPITNAINGLQEEFNVKSASQNTTISSQKDTLEKNRTSLENKINQYKEDERDEITSYEKSVSNKFNTQKNSSNNQVQTLSNQITSIKTEINELKNEKESLDRRKKVDISEINQNSDKKIKSYNNEKQEALNNLGPRPFLSGSWDTKRKDILSNFDSLINDIKSNLSKEINNYEQTYNQNVQIITSQITKLNNQIDDTNSEIKNIGGKTIEIPEIDQAEIKKIRNKYASRIKPLEQEMSNISKQLISISNESSGLSAQALKILTAKIETKRSELTELNKKKNQVIDETRKLYKKNINQLESDQAEELKKINDSQTVLKNLELQEASYKEDLEDKLEIVRNEAQKSQIYRLAASWYELDDVAKVNKEQLKWVSIIWFGSIALIISTMGTVLALISVILQDPDAFVARSPVNLKRIIGKIFLISGWRLNKLIKALANLVVSLTKLLISFAEIFRGFIGKPLQRSFRSFVIRLRKRINKPKIVIEKVEVEKEVVKEVEVEKIVEVEKEVIKEVEIEKIVEVEKEVIKEVPVDKIVIQEVPKEIIRKELVYVPLYSVDSGTIDTTKGTREVKPEFLKEAEATKEISTTKPTKNSKKKS
jgi:hypothetical protein